jgi:hypothetical protein
MGKSIVERRERKKKGVVSELGKAVRPPIPLSRARALNAPAEY